MKGCFLHIAFTLCKSAGLCDFSFTDHADVPRDWLQGHHPALIFDLTGGTDRQN